MKDIKFTHFYLVLLMLLGTSSLVSAQQVFQENFNTDPFPPINNINTGYGISTTNCANPSYAVQDEFDDACTFFPNFTGNGNFMVVDNSTTSANTVYSRDGLFLPAGNYVITFRSRTRFTQAGLIDLAVQVNGTPVATVGIPQSLANWQNPQATFSLGTTIASGTVALVQTGTNNEFDYAIDNISLEVDQTCEIPPARFTYCVNGNVYCFNALIPSQPGISYTYEWDFGDGFSATGLNPCHQFADGQYTVCLTVYGFREGSDEPCAEVTYCQEICVINPFDDCNCELKYMDVGHEQLGNSLGINVEVEANECSQISGYEVNWGDGTSEVFEGAKLPGALNHRYENGIYRYEVTALTRKGTTSCPETFTSAPIAMEEISKSHISYPDPGTHGLIVYPNPATTRLTLNHQVPEGAVFQVSVYDVNGHRVLHRKNLVSSGNVKIDLEQLSAGSYWLELQDVMGQKEMKKLIVQ